MVELYVSLIIAGLRTIDQVPKTIREKVREMLVVLGLYELAGVPLEPINP